MNKQKTRRPELLAPAGNMEKFFTALHFGADAVYLAGKNFGLRAFADNFTLDEIKFCCGYAHEKGKKVYVTVNIFADGRDLEKLPDYISALDNCGADALIVSDAGVMQIAKSVAPAAAPVDAGKLYQCPRRRVLAGRGSFAHCRRARVRV